MYAKVFSQIFNSSIADDYKVRHVFQDLLVLCDQFGVVDMTPQSISAQTRVPLKMVMAALTKLQSPDPRSRSPDEDGRRLVLLDSHRDWGWRIVNYAKYRAIRNGFDKRAYMCEYMRKSRASESKLDNPLDKSLTQSNSLDFTASASASASASVPEGGAGGNQSEPGKRPSRLARPTIEEVKLQGAKIGLPDSECVRFFDYYESNGWRVGKNPMRKWHNALSGWKHRWRQAHAVEQNGGRAQVPITQADLDQALLNEALR